MNTLADLLRDLALEQLVRGTLVLLAALVTGRLLAHGSARARYLVWLVALQSLLVPPLGLIQVPLWNSSGGDGTTASLAAAPASAMPDTPGSSMPGPASLAPANETRGSALSWTSAHLVVATWAAGMLLMLGLWFRQNLRLGRLIRGSRRAPATWQRLLDQHREDLGVRTPVSLRLTPRLASPCVVRARRPVLLLPERQSKEASPRSWSPVFVHELLHVRRQDLWIQHLVALIRALWFFHPTAWLGARMLARERERAVDESVVTQGGIHPMQYQQSLVEVAAQAARHAHTHPPAMALSPAARDLVHRIHLLRRGTVPRYRAWPAGAFALLVALGCATQASAGDDPAAARVQELARKYQVEPPAVAGPGLPLSAGGVRALLFLDRDGALRGVHEEAFQGIGDGFPESLAGILPEEIEEVLELDDGEQVEEIEEVVEEEGEEVFEFEEVTGLVELHVQNLDDEGTKQAFLVNTDRTESVAEVAALVERWLEGTPAKEGSLTVYGRQGARVGPVLDAISRIRARLPDLPILYAGVPADPSPRTRQVWESLDAHRDLRGDGEGDVVIVTDGRAPWSAHARILSWMGSRAIAKVTVAGLHEGKLVKLCQYLPRDVDLHGH